MLRRLLQHKRRIDLRQLCGCGGYTQIAGGHLVRNVRDLVCAVATLKHQLDELGKEGARIQRHRCFRRQYGFGGARRAVHQRR